MKVNIWIESSKPKNPFLAVESYHWNSIPLSLLSSTDGGFPSVPPPTLIIGSVVVTVSVLIVVFVPDTTKFGTVKVFVDVLYTNYISPVKFPFESPKTT